MSTVPKGPLVATLRGEWAAIDDLLSPLPDEAWATPSPLPGWTVHDVVSHIVGTESMLAGVDRPEARTDVGQRPHVRNDIGAVNEVWVDALRALTPAALLTRFREITARRAAMLEAMSQEEFDAPSWTPAGQATYARFMQIRVFDCWMHEQDIRDALDRPGHETGPAAEESLAEIVRALGYLVGKRGGAPDGAAVTITLTGPIQRTLHVVVDGRARVVDSLDVPPTAALALSSSLFLRLAGGRVDPHAVLDRIAMTGDRELASRIATNLAFTI